MDKLVRLFLRLGALLEPPALPVLQPIPLRKALAPTARAPR